MEALIARAASCELPATYKVTFIPKPAEVASGLTRLDFRVATEVSSLCGLHRV